MGAQWGNKGQPLNADARAVVGGIRAKKAKEAAPCVEIRSWLVDNCGSGCLAGLTGTDKKALAAAVHLLRLMFSMVTVEHFERDAPDLLLALRFIVVEMQEKERWTVYHAIAFVGEWHDRGRVWKLLSVDDGKPDPLPACKHEPNLKNIVRTVVDAFYDPDDPRPAIMQAAASPTGKLRAPDYNCGCGCAFSVHDPVGGPCDVHRPTLTAGTFTCERFHRPDALSSKART